MHASELGEQLVGTQLCFGFSRRIARSARLESDASQPLNLIGLRRSLEFLLRSLLRGFHTLLDTPFRYPTQVHRITALK